MKKKKILVLILKAHGEKQELERKVAFLYDELQKYKKMASEGLDLNESLHKEKEALLNELHELQEKYDKETEELNSKIDDILEHQ
jgi:cobalamin-dependent methionine synthase I